MKHLLLLLVLIVLAYVGWQLADKKARKVVTSELMYHSLRLGALILLLLLLVAAAVNLPASIIF